MNYAVKLRPARGTALILFKIELRLKLLGLVFTPELAVVVELCVLSGTA
jgi:hypothetical protein